MRLILALMLLVVSSATEAFDWQDGNNGKMKWARDCDFKGNDISSPRSRVEDCGGLCVSNQQCTHFTHWNGVCYIKKKVPYQTGAVGLNGGVCGYKYYFDDPIPG